MRTERLLGKSIIEVILELPKISWSFNDNREIVKTKISHLTFVDYQKKKPRDEIDLYETIDAQNLSLSTLQKYDLIREGSSDKCIGFTSRASLGKPYAREEHKRAHIPMIDFDTQEFDFLSDSALLRVIKENIREKTELEEGLLLKSSSKRNYHFISTERLFNENEFITFCGLCLAMKYKTSGGRYLNLADSRVIGHALSPMKYIVEVGRRYNENFSAYDFKDRFFTLRITPKRAGDEMPRVVDILK